ncbi:MAG: DUF4384 domain-containing protein [Deltaproteobacteria bacterium]|nr:DUF4384 domain-containing protein [Deltaproteobacteria bacterium]
MNKVIAFLFILLLPFFNTCSSYKSQMPPSKPELISIHKTDKEVIKDLGNGWFEVLGRAIIQNISPEEAERKAIVNACRDAIEYYSGVEISQRTLDLQAETQRKVLLNNFSALITQTTNGIILEKDIIHKSIKTDGNNLVAVVLLRVKVGKQKGKKDPYFNVSARLNRDTFKEGEQIELTVQSTKDCYITVLNICSNDKVYVLLPNKYRQNNFIKTGELFRLPNEGDKRMGLSFQARLLEGKDEDVEMIKVLATKANMSFALSPVHSSYGTYEMALKKLLNRLIKIPRGEIEEVDIQYFIKK